MIFYGVSGAGKTTVANIAASVCGKTLYKLNATNASVADIKNIVNQADGLLGQNGILLYLDEIQNFNKKQQQSLLEYTENGKITLIASTTENPYFYIYNALLSRCSVFEFKPISAEDIRKALERAVDFVSKNDFAGAEIKIDDDAMEHLSEKANGDVRKALNSLELAVRYSTLPVDGVIHITLSDAEQCTQQKAFVYDKKGDSQYDVMSALQKSIRGSDPNAAIYYLARMLAGGEDPKFIARRMFIAASEDIGNADPQALLVAEAAFKSAEVIGYPECRINLAQAAIYLALAPKSNAAEAGIDAALNEVRNGPSRNVPDHLRDRHRPGSENYGEYKYPHSYPSGWVSQRYLPDGLERGCFYRSSDRGWEAYRSDTFARDRLDSGENPTSRGR